MTSSKTMTTALKSTGDKDALSLEISTSADGQSNGLEKDPTKTVGRENGTSNIVADDPFDNERRRVLFEAINKLESQNTRAYLDIPQLVVVGEQSAGKSSLLKSLTDIPFPVKSGIGTRFPIRIVSLRSDQGTRERFSIYVEKAPQEVEGLGRADSAAETYVLEGDILTTSRFEAALKDISENKIGIIQGTGPFKKNFVPDIVTVQLSGPNRSLFNILDLPGIIMASCNVNEPEVGGTQDLAIQYISRPENTVICTVPATTELSSQMIVEMCKTHVKQKDRLIGVFTKCDKETSIDEINTIISSTKSKSEGGESVFENGMFVVCNKHDTENGLSRSKMEQDIFDKEPWSQIPIERRGVSKLKDYLGEILTLRIEQDFPKIEESIQVQLREKLARKSEMGEPRSTLSQKQAYINHYVRKYSTQASSALRNPGVLESRDLDLRQKLRTLNEQFDKVMRWVGGSWAFFDVGIDPFTRIMDYHKLLDSTDTNKEVRDQQAYEILNNAEDQVDFKVELSMIPAFEEHEHVGTCEEFTRTIGDYLNRFGASQPRGVINSDIYPVIYRLQVSKWRLIAHEHLERVKDALQQSYEGILHSVCPDSGITSTLHQELKQRLYSMFKATFEKAQCSMDEYCKQETERELLQTTDDEFPNQLHNWRALRYARAFHDGCTLQDGRAQSVVSGTTFLNIWNTMNLANEGRMINDIHDVVKVYYEITLKSFIRHITQSILEGFVMDKDGPLSKLTSEYVLSLSQEEVSQIAREDKDTGEMRDRLNIEITNLEAARDVVKAARDKVGTMRTV